MGFLLLIFYEKIKLVLINYQGRRLFSYFCINPNENKQINYS
jgi:hypothetical protein